MENSVVKAFAKELQKVVWSLEKEDKSAKFKEALEF